MRGRVNICACVPVNLPDGVDFTGIQPGTAALLTFALHEPGRVTSFSVNASASLQGIIAAETQRVRALAARCNGPHEHGVDGNQCDAIGDGWGCTRIKGHDGDHIACSSQRCNIFHWPRATTL